MLPHDDPVAIELALAVHFGQLDILQRLLADRPELASVGMIGPKGVESGWRTPLHVAADWPGYFPSAPESAAILLAAGADPNLDSGGRFPETPLHWTASNDDADVAVVLIDCGARLDTPGGSIGTPLDNAVGYGCWHVAQLLVDRGAAVDGLWQAAAMGMLTRLEELLSDTPAPSDSEVNHAFFHACHGGQLRAAQRLLRAGADLAAVPEYTSDSALDVALHPGTRREQLATWLREHGAIPSAGDTE